MGFSRQEDWSGLLFSSPGNLLSAGIKPAFLALQADSLPLSHLGSPYQRIVSNNSDHTWQFLTPPVKFFLGMLFVWYKTWSLSLFHAFCFQFINLSPPPKRPFPLPVKKVKALVTQSCLTLWDPMDCSPPGSSVHGILQEEYWSGLPSPSPGYLPYPGIIPGSPTLQADSLSSEPPIDWLLSQFFL